MGEISKEGQILEAARQVFIRKGMAGARMQEIANEAGINKALLHYYFRSKEKLYQRILLDVFKTINSGVTELLASKGHVFIKLEKLVSIYVEVFKQNPYLPLFFINEMGQNPKQFQMLLEKGILPVMKNFFIELMKEINMGKIKAIHPIHLLLNIMGMIVMPFAAKPMLAPLIENELGVDYDDVLDQRKEVVIDFVKNALRVA